MTGGGTAARLAAGLALLLLAACGSESRLAEAAPPVTLIPRYEVVLEGAPDPGFAGTAQEAAQIWRLQAEGAQSRAFLRRRAEGDVAVLEKLLRSRGYYEGSVAVALSPEAGDAPPTVTLTVTPGPLYTLAEHRLELTGPGTPPALDAAVLGSPVSRAAEAAAIVSAEDAAVGALRRDGYAYARFLDRSATRDDVTKTLSVTSRIDAGRAHVFGPVRFTGVTAVPEDYLASYIPWTEGARFDGSKLREFQKRLGATGLFTAVSAEPPDSAPGSAALPVLVTVEERLPRTVAAGLRFDSATGPEAYGTLTHRNLLGRNEEATVAAVAGVEEQSLTFAIGFPQVPVPEAEVKAALELRRETLQVYDEIGVTGFAGVERRVGDQLTWGVGGLAEASRIEDAGVTGDAYLLGLPAFLARDTTDDLLEPTTGTRARIEVTPFGGSYDGAPTGFAVIDATASVYVPIDTAADYVFATRARVATVFAEGIDRVPPTRRLYSGGGGSVRGYAQDSIGPLDAAVDPVGGLSVIEIAAELRARVWKAIGLAAFVEAGSVSEDPLPDFNEGVQTSAGLGVRYYSPVGPIRFDVGVPLNPRDSDDPVQFYFSIGQAF